MWMIKFNVTAQQTGLIRRYGIRRRVERKTGKIILIHIWEK